MKSEEKGKGEQGDPEGIAVRRRFIGGGGGGERKGGGREENPLFLPT